MEKEEFINETEILYKTMFEKTKDGFEIVELLYDEFENIYDYRWLKVNNAWEEQVGIKAENVIGKRATEIYSKVDSYWLEKYDMAYKSDTSIRYENYGAETKRWFDCTCFPLENKKVAILFRDITEKKHSEKAIEKSEQLYRTLFENNEDAFNIIELIYDENNNPIDYKFIELNKNWWKQTGIKNIDVVGKTVKEVFPNIENYWIELYDNILKSGKSVHYENYNKSTNRWYSVIAFPYTEGQVGNLFRDISKQKENEKQLQQSEKNSQELIEKLRKADENRNEFLNLFSHELRNPMAAAMMSLSLLNNTGLSNLQAKKAIETLDRQLKHLSGLVDDLLDVTRIKNNKVRLEKKILNVNEIVENAVNDHQANYDNKGVFLKLELSPIPLYIEADNVRIRQVLDNLLVNSLKFTDAEGTTILKVKKDDEKPEVVITIKDTGLGISSTRQPDLFDPFVQEDNSLARSHGGLGLGLAIVKGMVELHDGSVDVYSEGIGKGTLFTIILPLITDTIEVNDNIKEQNLQTPKDLKILLIDDNEDLTEIMCEMIEYLGYKAESASNGMDGISKAKEYNPDIIICDIGLPIMNGYEVAKNIRVDNALNSVFLIALSGYAQPEDVQRSIKAGFNIHLAKPISMDKLKITLDKFAYSNLS